MLKNPAYSAFLTLLPILIVIGLEFVRRKLAIPSELTRKLNHIALGIVAILGYIEGPTWLYAIIIGILTIVIFISYSKNILTSVHDVSRQTFGELFFPVGILAPLLLVADKPSIYIASILVVTLADSLAGIYGYVAKKKSKSLIGTLIFFCVTYLILILTANIELYQVLLVAVTVSLVERFSKYGSDNLTIPLAVTCMLLIMGTFNP